MLHHAPKTMRLTDFPLTSFFFLDENHYLCSTMQKKYEEMSREELIRELQLTTLRRQVTPHFLFNSLSVAVSLVAKSPKVGVKFLRKLAQMYRYLLRYGNEYTVPIESELELLNWYYESMSIRHVNSIKLDISPEVKKLKKHPLPPLSLQGLLENAIKHNVHTEQNPLEVRLYVEEKRFLVMENNFVPLVSQVESTKKGLTYMNETIKLLYDKEIQVINDNETFKVLIPLIKQR